MSRKRKKKWLITLTHVDEDELKNSGLPKDKELSSLPDILDGVIRKVAPNALDPDKFYLLTDAQKDRMVKHLNANSLPYHEYAMSRGEKCTIEGCTKHHECVIIQLYDRRQRTSGTRT
jgi:hypothetical protein